MKTIFLDTNIFMHCLPPDQIPWLEVFETDRVKIIVPTIVVDELDKNKDSHPQIKLRRRALERLKQLEAWSLAEPVEIREHVALILESRLPVVDFEALGLEKTKPDHLLIASLVQNRYEHEDADILLVAHDTGPRITARRLGFTASELPEEYRIKGEVDPLEKETRELKQRVQRFENALPKLSLAFCRGSVFDSRTAVTVSQVPPPLGEELENFMAKTRAKHPFMPTSLESGFKSLIADEDIQSYNKALRKFYAQYEKFYRQVHQRRITRGLTCTLNLTLLNNGTKPSEDVDVYMHFPDGFSIYLEGELPKPPKPPEVPKKPGTLTQPSFSSLLSSYTTNPLSGLSPNFEAFNLSPSNVSVPEIKKTNSYSVNFHVKRIKHNVPEELSRLHLVFESFESASNFTIDYELKAANLPDPVLGKLHVAVQKNESSTK